MRNSYSSAIYYINMPIYGLINMSLNWISQKLCCMLHWKSTKNLQLSSNPPMQTSCLNPMYFFNQRCTCIIQFNYFHPAIKKISLYSQAEKLKQPLSPRHPRVSLWSLSQKEKGLETPLLSSPAVPNSSCWDLPGQQAGGCCESKWLWFFFFFSKPEFNNFSW